MVDAELLLETPIVSVYDAVCDGADSEAAQEERTDETQMVFPYRGTFVRHCVGSTVAEANQVIFFNAGEGYRISHPVGNGDASLVLTIEPELLCELSPPGLRGPGDPFQFSVPRLRIDPRAQVLVALLLHVLRQSGTETLEAESLALTLAQRSLHSRTTHKPTMSGIRQQRLVDAAKLTLASDLGRRWTLAEIAQEVGTSPVYLTQLFHQAEGVPLYRYQMRLRLARALDLMARTGDLTELSLDLGFSSHSHFSAAFRQVYGRSPSSFRKAFRIN